MNKFRLITFDANGTLLRLKYPVGQIYSSVAKSYGFSFDPVKVEDGFRLAWKNMSESHPNFGRTTIEWKNWWRTIVIQSFTGSQNSGRTGGQFAGKDLERVADRLIETFSSDEGWALAEGCVETLDNIKSSQIKLGVISNFDSRLPGVLKSLNIYNYFDFILTSYEVGVMKPNPDIFKLAEIKANIESADDNSARCLHIGDNLELDFSAARNAGWDAVIISAKKDKILAQHPATDGNKLFSTLTEFNESFVKL